MIHLRAIVMAHSRGGETFEKDGLLCSYVMRAERMGGLMDILDLKGETERVGVIAGASGNLPALEAAICDAEKEGVDRVICLGDLVAFGPHGDEVMQVLSSRGIPTLSGEMDRALLRVRQGGEGTGGGALPRRWGEAIHWAAGSLGDDLSSFLSDLPLALRFRMGDLRCLAFHCAADDDSVIYRSDPSLAAEMKAVSEYRQEMERLDEASLLASLAEYFSSDVYIFSSPFLMGGDVYRRLARRHFVGVGALGRPHHGVMGSWTLLSAGHGLFQVASRTVSYDLETMLKAIRGSSAPRWLEDEFLAGFH